jgi:hypothetical protein
MPAFVYTKKKLSDDGEANRLKLAAEVTKLQDAGSTVPPALLAASKNKQLDTETLTAAIIELTGRVENNEAEITSLKSRVTSLESRVTALEVFHP